MTASLERPRRREWDLLGFEDGERPLSIQIYGSDAETMADVGLDPENDTLFGLYTGVPLDQRGGWYGNVLPDVIVLYRRPLLDACPTRSRLIHQIQLTLLHEIGHHFGFTEEEMEAWETEFAGLAEGQVES